MATIDIDKRYEEYLEKSKKLVAKYGKLDIIYLRVSTKTEGQQEEDQFPMILNDFDLEKELSALVAQKVIPAKVADKLANKLKGKNAKINREQLQTLTYKLRDVLNEYAKTGQINGKAPKREGSDQNMQKLVETVDKLEKRISYIETDKKPDLNYTTTDDIKVPELELDPLRDVPSDPESIIVLMKWLQYLMNKCGRDNLSNILDYYVDIGWISEDAKISLIDYSQGITEEKRDGGTSRKDVSDLPSKDHIQSFIFIQKLRGKQFDKHFIDRIDGKLARIIKKFDSH